MFITDFELYLRTACKCGYNTTTGIPGVTVRNESMRCFCNASFTESAA